MRKSLIEKGLPRLSIRRQAQLLNVNRNRLTPKVREFTPEDLELCREIDKLYLVRPFYGARYESGETMARRA